MIRDNHSLVDLLSRLFPDPIDKALEVIEIYKRKKEDTIEAWETLIRDKKEFYSDSISCINEDAWYRLLVDLQNCRKAWFYIYQRDVAFLLETLSFDFTCNPNLARERLAEIFRVKDLRVVTKSDLISSIWKKIKYINDKFPSLIKPYREEFLASFLTILYFVGDDMNERNFRRFSNNISMPYEVWIALLKKVRLHY